MERLVLEKKDVNETLTKRAKSSSQKAEEERSWHKATVVHEVHCRLTVEEGNQGEETAAEDDEHSVQEQSQQVESPALGVETEESGNVLQEEIVQKRDVLHCQHESQLQPQGEYSDERTHFVGFEEMEESVQNDKVKNGKRECHTEIFLRVLPKERTHPLLLQETRIREGVVVGEIEGFVEEVEQLLGGNDAPHIVLDEVEELQSFLEHSLILPLVEVVELDAIDDKKAIHKLTAHHFDHIGQRGE